MRDVGGAIGKRGESTSGARTQLAGSGEWFSALSMLDGLQEELTGSSSRLRADQLLAELAELDREKGVEEEERKNEVILRTLLENPAVSANSLYTSLRGRGITLSRTAIDNWRAAKGVRK